MIRISLISLVNNDMVISEVAKSIEEYGGYCPPDCEYLGYILEYPHCNLFDEYLVKTYRCKDCIHLFDEGLREKDQWTP
jgi:hypothetical protein